MRWRSHEHVIGAVTAVARRGTYVVQQFGTKWVLDAMGHDGLHLVDGGQRCVTKESAQELAAAVDTVVEAQVSGA